jgi:hypothetical protein
VPDGYLSEDEIPDQEENLLESKVYLNQKDEVTKN